MALKLDVADRCHVLCPGPNSRSLWGMSQASHLQTYDCQSAKLTRVANLFSVASKFYDPWPLIAMFVVGYLGGFGRRNPFNVINF